MAKKKKEQDDNEEETIVLKEGKTVLGVPIPAGTKVKVYKEPKNIWTPNFTSQTREHFWHPYSWKRTGVGMSKIYEKDLAEHYGMKGKVMRHFRGYNLQKGNACVPLRITLEFDDFEMTLDRAVHNMGDVRFYNVETGEQTPIRMPWDYTIVRKDEEREDFFAGDKFPYGYRVRVGESTAEALEGKTVSKFMVHGNHTLAVGLLPTNIELVFSDGLVVSVGAGCMDKKAINSVLGRKCAKQMNLLYALRMDAGRYKG